MYLEKVINQAEENGWDETLSFSHPNQIKGCTPQEIAELEQQLKLELPLAYKEFLLYAGKGLGSFENGSRIFYDDDVGLIELQQIAREFLAEDDFPQKLPDDAYVFWMHQGYMFCFFRTSEGDNPPVHFHQESFKDDFAWNHQKHFTDFLIVEMRDQAKHLENAQRLEAELARDWRNG